MLTRKIRFSEEGFIRGLIVLQIIVVLSFLFLIDNFHFPSWISYITDLIWMTLLISILFNRRKIPYLRGFRNWIVFFVLYTVLTLIIYRQSFLLYLWGARNNFRFYVFFLACVLFLRRKDIDAALKIIMVFYYINFVLCLYQFYVLNKSMDGLGGIFGIQTGCNAYMNLFLVIVCTYQILSFLYKKTSIIRFLAVIAIGCYLAALAELKIFFVEICLVAVLTALFTRFSWRKLVLLVGCVGALLLAVNLMYTIFPQWRNFFTFEKVYSNVTDLNGYTGTGDLNRLSAISSINQRFFNGDVFRQLFGYGLGSCEYSSNFDFLMSNFYSVYSRLHYVWLSNAWMYLETGYFGLFFLNGFFIISFIVGSRIKPGNDDEYIAVNMARVIALCSIVMAVYNVSLRVECGYLAYFVLSLPLIINKERIAEVHPVAVSAPSAAGNRSSYIRKKPVLLRAMHGGK